MWILISKKLYDANKTISEQQAGPSVDLSKYYWYNTDTKQILPATEIPQSGVVDGQPINVNAPGVRTDISQNAKNLWFDSSKEVLYDDALSQFGISIGSDIGEFFKLASQYGISTFGYGEEGSIYQTTDEIKNKIAADLIDLITNNAFTDKNLVEINKIQNEGIDLLQFKTQGPVVTIFKGNAEKEINQTDLTLFLQEGWTTSKPTDDKDEQDEKPKVSDRDDIKNIQTFLKNAGFDPGPIDGLVGPLTRGAALNYVKSLSGRGQNSAYEYYNKKLGGIGDLSDIDTTDDEDDEVVTTTTETVGISNNWNTDGSNIINLNGKRYALFEKDNTFRSAGSEEEFNQILGEGFTPIGNQNPLWLNFAESENLDDIEIIITDETSYDTEDIVTPSSQGESVETSTEVIDFNNVPKGSKLTEVDGNLYLMYAVPGQGQLYTGATMFMAYEVVGNDIFAAGLLTEGASAPTANYSMDKKFFDTVAIVAGNTNEIIGIEDDPFASFVETYSEEAQLRPWLLDPEFIAIQAEAAIENREISDTEWRLTNWYQTHNEAERAWMDLELSDPAEAARQLNDLEIFYENQLSSLGVSGVPDGLVQWISSKNISGQWSDTYTAEQLNLFSDPYKSGDRDAELQNLISTSGFGDVDRTAAREREVVELYRKWLGPTLGSLTQDEVSEIAGRLRDDPDYEDALIQNLKQNRLAAFSNYTNPELTYEDIARPWRNLTTSVWGQTADETQGWWQEMVKTNDFAKAQETLRTKGLEQNVTQVTTDATQALQQALGQGQVSQLGVNV